MYNLSNAMFLTPIYVASLVGLFSGIFGAISFLKRESLIAETLSHVAYPGVMLGVILFQLYLPDSWNVSGIFLLSVFASFFSITFIELASRMSAFSTGNKDAFLAWLISSAMGLGILIVSIFQKKFSYLTSYVNSFIYGHLVSADNGIVVTLLIYLLFVLMFLIFNHRFLSLCVFDKNFALIHFKKKFKIFDFIIRILTAFTVAMSVSTVGVIVVSSLMIAPAIAAVRVTRSFIGMIICSAFIGLISSLSGCLLSIYFEQFCLIKMPVGPCISIVSCCLAMLFVFFSWHNGIFFIYARRKIYVLRCIEENILKFLLNRNSPSSFREISKNVAGCKLVKFFTVIMMERKGLIISKDRAYKLTDYGKKIAKHILHLHELCELCLIEFANTSTEEGHNYAEKLEHINDPYIKDTLEDFFPGVDTKIDKIVEQEDNE